MNTRLQVEHPVTEMITGLDLVEWQLCIANNAPLPLTQSDVHIDGHAIEVRIYAEDPDNDFMPASGDITFLKQPPTSQHVRIDTGIRQGDEISPFYDPMIAKLIVWDHTRDLALLRLQSALSDYKIAGIKTNIGFLTQLAQVPALQEAALNTDFIITHANALLPDSMNLEYAFILAAMALELHQNSTKDSIKNTVDSHSSPWDEATGWRLNQPAINSQKLMTEDGVHCRVSLIKQAQDYKVELSSLTPTNTAPPEHLSYNVSGELDDSELDNSELVAFIDGHRVKATAVITAFNITLFYAGQRLVLLRQLAIKNHASQANHANELEAKITAPMNGVIVSVLCQPEQLVEAGEPLIVMEAMKMECNITAPTAGVISTVFYQDGDMVEDGAELIQLTPSLALDKKEQVS